VEFKALAWPIDRAGVELFSTGCTMWKSPRKGQKR
jgi:hypothetical protein